MNIPNITSLVSIRAHRVELALREVNLQKAHILVLQNKLNTISNQLEYVKNEKESISIRVQVLAGSGLLSVEEINTIESRRKLLNQQEHDFLLQIKKIKQEIYDAQILLVTAINKYRITIVKKDNAVEFKNKIIRHKYLLQNKNEESDLEDLTYI